MNWSMLITFMILCIPLAEWSSIRKLQSKKEWIVFGGCWTLALVAMFGEWMGWPMPKPLNWIRAVIEPVARLIP